MNSKRTTKSKKKHIELLTTCFGWEEGHVTTVLEEDEENFYFNDEWGRWSTIDKNKDGIVFKIVGNEYPEMKCGGEETPYNKLRRRAKELKKERKNDSI